MAKQSRPPAPVRRSPRAVRRAPARVVVPERPVAAACAAVFGVLVAAEVVYLAWLLAAPDEELAAAPGWVVGVLGLLACWALAGAALVVLGRGRGWLVLAAGSVLPLLGLLAVALLFGSLGAGSSTWWAVLMAVGPLGSLVLALQRPVREWTTR